MKRAVTVVIALGVAFLALAAAAAWRGVWSSGVTAHVTNGTSQGLRSVTIRFETCGKHASVSSGAVAPGESRRLRYAVCGEGGYVVEATFSDGRIIRGGGGYVETGSVSTDRISSAGISSQQSWY
jgi:hypothetical protein